MGYGKERKDLRNIYEQIAPKLPFAAIGTRRILEMEEDRGECCGRFIFFIFYNPNTLNHSPFSPFPFYYFNYFVKQKKDEDTNKIEEKDRKEEDDTKEEKTIEKEEEYAKEKEDGTGGWPRQMGEMKEGE